MCALPQQVPASGVVKFSGPGPAKSGCEALSLVGRPADAALTAPVSGVQLTTVLLVYRSLSARRCEKGRITLCAPGQPRIRPSLQGASPSHAGDQGLVDVPLAHHAALREGRIPRAAPQGAQGHQLCWQQRKQDRT